MSEIPKRFIRIWLGPKSIPNKFDEWWLQFQEIHPDYEFLTLQDKDESIIPQSLKAIYKDVGSYAGRADILRIVALKEFGGIYIDTDVMPLRSFNDLLTQSKPFAGMRSKKSFEIAVLGSPKDHPVLNDTIKALPKWYSDHKGKSCSVATGPAFISSVWFGRKDILHLPPKAFYPFNGFGAPKREEKIRMFSKSDNFDKGMFCAHFSNHRWGGKPK